ncbi:hypothetical protein D3C85_1079380 [compost metagenome]
MIWSYCTARSPRRITGRSGVEAMEARNSCSSSAIETGTASIDTVPSLATAMTRDLG